MYFLSGFVFSLDIFQRSLYGKLCEHIVKLKANEALSLVAIMVILWVINRFFK